MKVTINRESPVPLHDQLVQQIALQIAGGVLRPGARLPSIRDLARRLDVHPNTVSSVYKELEVFGVVTVRQGSGVRVIEQEAPEPPSLAALARRFLREARAAGHDDGAIAEAFERALRPEKVERLIVVDPHTDFHALYFHELGPKIPLRLEVMTFEQLAGATAEQLAGAALASSMYHLVHAQKAAGRGRRVLAFQTSTGEDMLSQMRAIPTGKTLALVSVSETLLAMARELVAALRGEDLLLLECAPDDGERLESVVRLADMLACDGPSTATVRARTQKPVSSLQIMPEASLQALIAQLP